MFDDVAMRRCDHTPDLVAYMYGECDENRRVAFEAHVTGCAACAADLASFTGLRTAFSGLRAEALSTMPPIRVNLEPDEASNSSLLGRILGIFGAPKGLIGAGTFAVALLALVAAFQIQRTERQAGAEIAANTSQASSENWNSPSQAQQQPTSVETTPSVYPAPSEGMSVSTRPEANPKPGTSRQGKGITRRSSKTEKAPTLSAFDEDEEDETLRLSDLFGQIGD